METATESRRPGSRQISRYAFSDGQIITTQYVLALGLIAVLVIISYAALLDLMTSHATWAAAINKSGMQRMMSQRISKLAHDVVMRTHNDNVALRAEMREWAKR